MLRRKNTADPTERELAELRRMEEALERQRREMEQLVREVPRRKQEAMATMPPPDDLRDREREHKFYLELATRGEVRNEIRAQAGNTLVLLMLVAATAAVILWMIQMVHGS